MTRTTVTVADCERVQTSWFQLHSEVLGADAWEDTGLVWANGDLLFPRVIDPGALGRGVERARATGTTVVGAWLGLDVDPGPLAAAGFERGWSPWWMAGPAELGLAADPRVELQEHTADDATRRSSPWPGCEPPAPGTRRRTRTADWQAGRGRTSSATWPGSSMSRCRRRSGGAAWVLP